MSETLHTGKECGDPLADFKPGPREWAGFWSVMIQQTQNAFNDKMAQFLLVPLGAAVGIAVESYAGILIALPFVLFAPLAGWINDRFSKRTVVIGSAIFQLVVLLWITVEVMQHRLVGAMSGFFLLAVQSAFFSPAKIGLNKELLGTKHLGMASGLQQAMAMLAILAGQIAAGAIFDSRWKSLGGSTEMAWQAALVPLIILTIAAVPAVFMGWILPPLQAQSREPFRMSLLVGHFQDLRTLWSDLPLRHGSFGVAFFWGFAAFINLWSLKLARELTQGGEGFGSISSLFMASASIGMAAGFGAASVLQRRRIQLGWVPISSIMMFVCALVLCAIPYGTAEGYKILIGLAEPVAGRSSMQEYVFLGTLLCLAFSSALFLAPLNAWMQDRYPADKRGEMQSAVNLQDCLAGIFAVLVIAGVSLVCEKLHLSGLASVRWQVLVVSLLCLVATIHALRMLTAEFLRVLVLPVIRLVYKIRVVGREHVPDKGGVLLLPNHVTWADSFFLSAACHRPIRFVMYDGFMTAKGVGWFARLFDTVPISSTKAKDAIRVVADALNEGHVVCLFGEGELTRTGCLQEIKRGFELMVRKAGTPVVPVWMDGAWGSIFSFERGKFFKKTPYRLPYPMTLVFESPILASDANAESVRSAMLHGSSRALRVRAEATGLMKRKNPEQWVNGLQLGQVNALQRGQEFALWSGDALFPKLGAVSTAFASLFSCKVLSDEKDLLTTAVRVGGSATHARLCAAGANAVPGLFYDFSNKLLDGLPAQILHCRCLLRDGVVLAMSMPNPPRGAATSPEQWGLREGTVGRLIPGFAATCEDGGLRFTGPGISDDGGIFLPESSMDELGFIKIEVKQ